MIKQGLVCVASLLSTQLAFAKEFHFCVENQHYAPFIINTGEVSEGQSGAAPDMVFAASKLANIKVSFERQPWKRCKAELAEGDIDAIVPFIYNQERASWAMFPTTHNKLDSRYLYQSNYMIFTYPGSGLSWDGETLMPRSASVQSISGYIADEELQTMGFEPMAQLQPKSALKLVSRQLLDGFVVNEIIGNELIKELALEGSVVPLEIPFMSQQWYVAFSQQTYAEHPKQVEAFWTALRTVRINDSEALFAKYE